MIIKKKRIHLLSHLVLAHVSQASPSWAKPIQANEYECIHTNNLLLVDTVTDVIVIIIILCTTLNGHLSHVPTIFFVTEIAPKSARLDEHSFTHIHMRISPNDNVCNAVPANGTSVCVGIQTLCMCVRVCIESRAGEHAQSNNTHTYLHTHDRQSGIVVIVGWLFESLLSHACTMINNNIIELNCCCCCRFCCCCFSLSSTMSHIVLNVAMRVKFFSISFFFPFVLHPGSYLKLLLIGRVIGCSSFRYR